MKKLSLFLATILFTVIGITNAIATENQQAPPIPTHGTCGENAVWYIRDENILVVEGSGKTGKPCAEQGTVSLKGIKRIEISEGITEIAEYAFYNCDALESVSLPNSLEKLGRSAFYSCDSLGYIIIPDNVREIGSSCFYGCTALTYAYVGKGVEKMDDGSIFVGCKGLETIEVCDENEYFFADDRGALYNKDATLLIQYPAGNPEEKYTVRYSAEKITRFAFDYASNLSEITLSDRMKVLESGTFYNIPVRKINLGKGIEKIEKNAALYLKNLESLHIPQSLTEIQTGFFSDDVYIKNVTVDSENPCYSLDSYGILYKNGRESLVFCPKNLSVTEITIPEGVKRIEPYAFYGNQKIEGVSFPKSLEYIGRGAFSDCPLRKALIPENVREIESFAFDTDTEFKITVANPAIKLAASSLGYYNTRTTIVGYPKSTAEEYAENHNQKFSYYTGKGTYGTYGFMVEKGWYVNPEMKLSVYGEGSLYTGMHYAPWVHMTESIKYAEIKDGLSDIPDYAFYGALSLSEIHLGKDVSLIGCSALDITPNLKAFFVSEENTVFSTDGTTLSEIAKDKKGGVLLDKSGEILIKYPTGRQDVGYTVSEKVKTIGEGAFANSRLKSVILTGTEKISEYGFYYSTSLESVILGDSLARIDAYAFYGCRNLKNIIIPEALTHIDNKAFASCESLGTVLIPQSVTYIATDAFDGCESITLVVVRDSYAHRFAADNGIEFITY